MSPADHRDQVVDEVTDKVLHRPATEAPEDEVRDMSEDAVDGLIEAPVQTFTPLLAENEVVSRLHQPGPDEPGPDEPGPEEETPSG